MKKLKLSKYYWIPVFILIMLFFAYSADVLQNDQEIEFQEFPQKFMDRRG